MLPGTLSVLTTGTILMPLWSALVQDTPLNQVHIILAVRKFSYRQYSRTFRGPHDIECEEISYVMLLLCMYTVSTLFHYGRGQNSILPRYIQCSGSEDQLSDCDIRLSSTEPCAQVVGVICEGLTLQPHNSHISGVAETNFNCFSVWNHRQERSLVNTQCMCMRILQQLILVWRPLGLPDLIHHPCMWELQK